jgi:hypothetical protein
MMLAYAYSREKARSPTSYDRHLHGAKMDAAGFPRGCYQPAFTMRATCGMAPSVRSR